MRKGLILAGLMTVLCFAPAFAKAEQIGMYVTPKFIYGATIMNNTKIHQDYVGGTGSDGDSFKISNGSDSVYGGSLALGYDFHERFKLPVRAEIEYAFFSEAKNKASTSYNYEGALYSGSERGSIEQRFGIQTLFLNAYYDFHNSSAFTPYIGGGLGVAFINTKAKVGYAETYGGDTYSDDFSTGSKTRSNFAWNIGLGVAYDFTENIALDLGYRFAGLGSVKTKTSSWEDGGDTMSLHGKTQDLYMHQIALGIRFSF